MNTEDPDKNDEVAETWFFQPLGGYPAFEVEMTAADIAELDSGRLVGNEKRFRVWLQWVSEHPPTEAHKAAYRAEMEHWDAHEWMLPCECDDTTQASDSSIRKPDAYFAAAIQGGVKQVRGAQVGDRNNTLFKVAAALFGLPARVGFVGSQAAAASEQVREALFDAAVDSGLKAGEVETTLRSASAAADEGIVAAATEEAEMFW